MKPNTQSNSNISPVVQFTVTVPASAYEEILRKVKAVNSPEFGEQEAISSAIIAWAELQRNPPVSFFDK